MKPFTTKAAIECAIRTERKGYEFYSFLADKYSNQAGLADIFSQLARDEKSHESEFEKVLSVLPVEQDPENEEDDPFLLWPSTVSDVFKHEGAEPEEGLIPGDALMSAMDLEIATLQHYAALNKILNSEWLKVIINTEKKHIKILKDVILNGDDFNGLSRPFR